LLKPLSTLLVMLVCFLPLTRPNADPAYTWPILLGLLFSLGGDMALMFPSDKAFLLGVAAFLLAHVVYGATLGWLGGLPGPLLWPGLALAVIGVGFYAYLYPHLGKMRVPVGAYTLVISAMVLTAISTLHSDAFSAAQSWLVTVGATLFYISDMILAIYKFVRPIKLGRLFNLSAYYCGQLLIALSAAYALGTVT